MKQTLAAIVCFTICFTSSSFAESVGHVAAGEALFKQCTACHMVQDANGNEIVKGGKVGPNLFNIVGRTPGTFEGYRRYSDSIKELSQTGYVWDEVGLAAWMEDSSKYLKTTLDKPSAKSRMPFKLKSGSAEIAAYLASLAQ